MNTQVLQSLTHILRRYGPHIVNDIRRLESLLRDLHPDSPLEVAILIEALSSGVVTRLQLFLAQSGEASLMPADRDDLVRHLTESSGISGRFALWAVDGWLQTLGVEASGSQTPPDPGRKRGSLVRDRAGTLEAVLGRHLRKSAPRNPANSEA
jgi:hypothetical protein